MTIRELQLLNQSDLLIRLSSLREQLRRLRFKIYSKEVKNNHQMKELRRDIARILTVLHSK